MSDKRRNYDEELVAALRSTTSCAGCATKSSAFAWNARFKKKP
jgi:hypothetical protein